MMLQRKKGLTVLLAVLTMLVSLAAPVSAAEAAGPSPGQEAEITPASLFPLEEQELALVNLSGRLPDELRAVPLSALLGERDLDGTVAWRFLDNSSYTISDGGSALDLSGLWTAAVSLRRLEILVPGDPTDPQAVRYIVPVQVSTVKNLLKITAWNPDGEQIADDFSCALWDASSLPQFTGSANEAWTPEDGAVLKMAFSDDFRDLTGVEARVYRGAFHTPEDIPPDADVTERIWGSGAAGCGVENGEALFTLTVARAGETILVMPFSLILSPQASVRIRCSQLFDATPENPVLDRAEDDDTLTLIEGADPGGRYHLVLKATDLAPEGSQPVIAGAYVGSYASMEAAEAAGSENIADRLFSSGYAADYSQGVVFSIFDCHGLRHLRRFQTRAYVSQGETLPSDQDPYFSVTGVDGGYAAYCVRGSDDSLYADGWQTVFLLHQTGEPVRAERIRPVFTAGRGVSIYSDTAPQISGETEQPFRSGEALPYLAVTGQGERPYRVTFLTRQTGGPSLFISGVTNGGNRDEAGLFQISPDMDREGFYDILTANIGDEAITNLQVSLRSGKNVRLDHYWDFGAASSLAAFTSAEPLTASGERPQYGALFNLTKLRLVKTGDGQPAGLLTITADGIEPVHIRLPGQLDLPVITTEALPEAAQGAPYSHRLQIQVPDGWEDVVFSPLSPLPGGLELRPDGEICGVPKVHGTFEVTVKLSSGSIACDQRTFSLEIADNAVPPLPEEPDPPIPPEEPEPPEEPDLPVTPEEPDPPVPPEEPDPPEPPEEPDLPVVPEEPSLPATPEDPAPPEDIDPPSLPDSSDDPPQPDMPSPPDGSDLPIDKPVPFADISAGDWFYEDVCWAYRQGLMLGDPGQRFVPEQSVSQATIVTVLARIMAVDLTQYDASPSVQPGMWYTQAAIWAQRAGLLPDNQTFTGTAPISRQDLAIMLNNYLVSMGVPPTDGGSIDFEDGDQMSEAGRIAFQALYRHGIFKGVGGLRMDPEGVTTRAQFAALIHRISLLIEDS